MADTFLAPFRAVPLVFGHIASSNPLSRVLSTDLTPLDQGFIAGALLYLCVSLVPIGHPDIVRALSYSPFPESIRLDYEAVPDVLEVDAPAEGNAGADRHISEETT
ncbi:MAG: hypothetical protein ACOCRN_03685, partial [Spirochaetia bacterium]